MFWTIAGGVCVGIILAVTILKMTEDDWKSIRSLIKRGTYILVVVVIVLYVKENGLPGRMETICRIIGYICVIGYGLFWIVLILAAKIDSFGSFLEKFMKKNVEDLEDNKLDNTTNNSPEKDTKKKLAKKIDKTRKNN